MSDVSQVDCRNGEAKIKSEFLVSNLKRTMNLEYVSKEDKEKCLDRSQGEPPMKKLKGQNKHRPREARIPRTQKFCPNIIENDSCSYGDKCYYIHSASEYLANKPADIQNECYLFRTYGKCIYGLTCRFALNHITPNGKNIIKEDIWQQWKEFKTTVNNLKKDIQISLRRRSYDFSVSNEIIKCIQKNNSLKNKDSERFLKNSANNEVKNELTTLEQIPSAQAVVSSESLSSINTTLETDLDKLPVDNNNINNDAKISMNIKAKMESNNTGTNNHVEAVNDKYVTCGVVTDQDCIKLRKPEIKQVTFNKKLYLAPLTTVGNLPFRRICKQFGAEITCGEMAMAINLLQGQQSEWALLKRHHSEKVFGVQICGGHADIMTRCSQLLMENADVDFVDINVGCPLDFVCNKGSGCGLMNKTRKFEEIVFGMSSVLTVPLTAKIRTGVYENKNTAHTLIPHLRDWGLSLATIHGRSREQRYTKKANWEYINQCAELAHPMPLFGNGDVLSYEDYYNHLENTAVDGVMIARGAMIKPWLFTEIKENRHWDISSQERFDILQDYVNYGLEHWGADTEGVEKTRRFLLEWLSFLYRYIPVGLLEVLPQRINDRPPFYVGRNDLETLMSSPKCSDWIKISEMFLGPVPSNFSFLPKHKANSY